MDLRPVLTRLDMCFYSATGAGAALRPDMSLPGNPVARMLIYRQGATTTASTVVPIAGAPPVDMAVEDVGGVVVGGALQIGPAPGYPVLTVVGIAATSISVQNTQPVVFAVPAGVRLLVLLPGAYLFQSPLGTDANLTNEMNLEGPYARARGYVRERRFDLVRIKNGTEYNLYADLVGGFVMRG